MIRPAKHLNLNVCVLRIAAIVLAHLQRFRVEGCTTLLAKVREAAGPDAEVWFLPAIDLLYLLGRIEYHAKTDTFEFIGPAKGKAR
jgi:hypothetical protein